MGGGFGELLREKREKESLRERKRKVKLRSEAAHEAFVSGVGT